MRVQKVLVLVEQLELLGKQQCLQLTPLTARRGNEVTHVISVLASVDSTHLRTTTVGTTATTTVEVGIFYGACFYTEAFLDRSTSFSSLDSRATNSYFSERVCM